MAIDPEVLSSSSKKGHRSGRYIPKWAVYSAAGVGVLLLMGLIKTLLPVMEWLFYWLLFGRNQ